MAIEHVLMAVPTFSLRTVGLRFGTQRSNMFQSSRFLEELAAGFSCDVSKRH